MNLYFLRHYYIVELTSNIAMSRIGLNQSNMQSYRGTTPQLQINHIYEYKLGIQYIEHHIVIGAMVALNYLLLFIL